MYHKKGHQISFAGLLHSLLFRPYEEHLLMGERSMGAAIDEFGEELWTYFHGGPLNPEFYISGALDVVIS